jgi:hypothetical protein
MKEWLLLILLVLLLVNKTKLMFLNLSNVWKVMLMLLVMLVNVLLVDNLILYTKLIILGVVKIFVLHLKYLV